MAILPNLSAFGTAIQSISAIQAGAEVSSTRLAASFSLLTPVQIANIAATHQLAEADLKAALSSSTLTDAQQKEVLEHLQATSAKAANKTATEGLAKGEITLAGVTKGLWATIAAHPFITLAAAVSAALFALHQYEEHIQDTIDTAKELQKQYTESTKSLADNKATVETLADEFGTLSKGVGAAGENVSLAKEDYQRYLELVNQLVEINPKLVRGYNSEGQAIIDKNSAIQETIDLLKEQQKYELVQATSTENNWDIAKGLRNSYRQARAEADEIRYDMVGVLQTAIEGMIADGADVTQLQAALSELFKVDMTGSRYSQGFVQLRNQSAETAEVIKANINEITALLDNDGAAAMLHIVSQWQAAEGAAESAAKSYQSQMQLIAQASAGYDQIDDASRRFVNTWISTWKMTGEESQADIDRLTNRIGAMVLALSDTDLQGKLASVMQIDWGSLSGAVYDSALSHADDVLEAVQAALGLSDEEILQIKLSLGVAMEVRGDDGSILGSRSELTDYVKNKLQALIGTTMTSEYQLGNVNLTARPTVKLDGGYESVLNTWQDAVLNDGKRYAIHLTPILDNGELLDDNALAAYVNDLVERAASGSDLLELDSAANGGLGIVLNVQAQADHQSDDDFVSKNKAWAQSLYEIQAGYYGVDAALSGLDTDQLAALAETDQIEGGILTTADALEELGLTAEQAGAQAAGAAETLDAMRAKLSATESDAQLLQQAMDALQADSLASFLTADAGEQLDSLLSKFPQLRDELTAYANGLMDAKTLQKAFNAAMADFTADAVYDGVNAVVDACETYGAASNQVLQAVQDLEAYVPGLTALLYDQETGFLRVDAAAMSGADSLYAFLQQAANANVSQLKNELAELEAQLLNVRDGAAQAFGATSWATATASQKKGAMGYVRAEEADLKNQQSIVNAQISAMIDSINSISFARQRYTRTSSKSSSSTSSKEVEVYTAEIDRLYESEKRLSEIQEKIATAEVKFDLIDEDDVNAQRAAIQELIVLYRQEQDALHALNNDRDAQIQEIVATLRERRFDVDYDPENNRFWVNNMAHLNELTAQTKGEYDSIQEATNALIQDTEDLIALAEELNEANVDGSLEWWNLEQKRKDLLSEIDELQQKILDERLEALNDTKDSLTSIIDLEKDRIKQEKEDMIDALEDQKDFYEKIIELKKQSLKLTERERSHQETVNDLNSQMQKIQRRIDLLKLDSSAEGKLALGEALEEQAELQKKLDDEMREYSLDNQEDALDDELTLFENAQDEKIAEIKKFLNDNQALTQAAMDHLDRQGDALFDDLLNYALTYTDTTREEFLRMWNDALAAAKEYGSYTAAMNGINTEISYGESGNFDATAIGGMVNQMKQNSLDWWTADSESQRAALNQANNGIANEIKAKTGITVQYDGSTGKWVDANNPDMVYNQLTADEIAVHIVAKMKENSQAWHNASGLEQARLAEENRMLAKRVEQATGQRVDQIYKDHGDYDWYIGSQKLYQKYHSGTPSVGRLPTPKQNEVFSLLERGEAVYTEPMQRTLERMVGFVKSAMDGLKGIQATSRYVSSPAAVNGAPIQLDASVHIDGYADKHVIEILKRHPYDVAEVVAKQWTK